MPGEGVLCSPAHPSSLGEGFCGEPVVGAAHGHPATQPRGGVAVSAAVRVAGVRGTALGGGRVYVHKRVCERFGVCLCVYVREPGTGRAALRFGGEWLAPHSLCQTPPPSSPPGIPQHMSHC